MTTPLTLPEQAELALPWDPEDETMSSMDVPSVEDLEPVPGFTGKFVKRVCAQGFIFHTLDESQPMVLLWFETATVVERRDVKRLIETFKFDTVYQCKDVHEFTPWINNGKPRWWTLIAHGLVFSDQDRAVLIDDLALYDRFCLPEKVQRVMAWTPGCSMTPKYSLRKKYAHLEVTGRQTHGVDKVSP